MQLICTEITDTATQIIRCKHRLLILSSFVGEWSRLNFRPYNKVFI